MDIGEHYVASLEAFMDALPARPAEVLAATLQRAGAEDEHLDFLTELSNGHLVHTRRVRDGADWRSVHVGDDAPDLADWEALEEDSRSLTEACEKARAARWGPKGRAAAENDLVVRTRATPPALIPILDIARTVLSAHPRVVGVSCTPDIATTGDHVHLTAVLRTPAREMPPEVMVGLGQLLHEITGRVQSVAGVDAKEITIHFKAAAELDYPPTGIGGDDHDPWLEVKGLLLRLLMADTSVVAAWLRPGRSADVLILRDRTAEPGEAEQLTEMVRAEYPRKDVTIGHVRALEDVPRAYVCFFNSVTTRLHAAPQGLLDPGPLTSCRWCEKDVARSDNPEYTGKCGWCGALLSATTFPTKNPHQPAIQIWVNPDGTCWLDVLFAPKAPGRLDTSAVWRYQLGHLGIPQRFDENPMGMKAPK